MTKYFKKILFLCVIFLGGLLTGCGGTQGSAYPADYYEPNYYYPGGEEFTDIEEAGFVKTSDQSTMTVSLDSSTAGYSYLRNAIRNRSLLTMNKIIIEDMVNYFKYDYRGPNPVNLYGEVGECPWDPNSKLAMFAVKAQEIEFNQSNGNNIVLVLDVSGSMQSRMTLVKNSVKLLIDQMADNDYLSLITYSNTSKVVFKNEKCSNKTALVDIVSNLTASGSTNFSSAISDAYDLAKKTKIAGGNNRILLITDGDFNVGITGKGDLSNYLKQHAAEGIYLTVCGVGLGNYKNTQLENLAKSGNGNAFYIDDEKECLRSFVEEIGGTMLTVAKDVKAQITFNENMVEYYRLLGYENQMLNNDDYEDPSVDAGELNSGHTVLIFVQLRMKDGYLATDQEYGHLGVKYKNPNDPEIIPPVEVTMTLNKNKENEGVSYNFLWGSAVVEFALIARNSVFKGNSSIEHLKSILSQLIVIGTDSYREEFVELVDLYDLYYSNHNQ